MLLGGWAFAKREEGAEGDVRQGETGTSASIGGRGLDRDGLSPSLAIPPPEEPGELDWPPLAALKWVLLNARSI